MALALQLRARRLTAHEALEVLGAVGHEPALLARHGGATLEDHSAVAIAQHLGTGREARKQGAGVRATHAPA